MYNIIILIDTLTDILFDIDWYRLMVIDNWSILITIDIDIGIDVHQYSPNFIKNKAFFLYFMCSIILKKYCAIMVTYTNVYINQYQSISININQY
jgi:hypothetical protein